MFSCLRPLLACVSWWFTCENLGTWQAKATYTVHRGSIFETENIDLHLLKACWSRQFKQLQNTSRQHWSAVQISDCTILFFRKTKIISHRNLASRSLIIGTWESIHASSKLDPCILKLELFKLWDVRIESRVSSFKCQLTFVGTLDWDDLPGRLPVRQVNYY